MLRREQCEFLCLESVSLLQGVQGGVIDENEALITRRLNVVVQHIAGARLLHLMSP